MVRKFSGALIPAQEPRKARRALEEELRRLRQPAPPDKDEAPMSGPLPKPWGDRKKPRSWWGPTRVFPKTHRATALRASAAYPFLSEVGLGYRGAWMGKLGHLSGGGDFVFDPFELYQQGFVTGTSMVWLGTVGTGKSAGAKSYACRMATLGVKVAVASDPKGEWVKPALAMGGVVISLSPAGHNRLNPLDEGPRDSRLSQIEWDGLVGSRRRLVLTAIIPTLIGRPLRPEEHTALDVALSTATVRPAGAVVTIRDVYECILSPDGEEASALKAAGVDVAHGLRRLVIGDLAGVFDGESTVKFDADAPMVVMDTSGFMGASATLLSVATTCVAAWLEAAVMDPSAGKRIIIYDEGWRMLRDEAMLLRMSEQWKLARAYGLANLLIMHRITDLEMVGDAGSATRALAEGLLTDAEIRVVYRQEKNVLAATKVALGLTDAELAEVASLARGVGLWKIGARPFIVRNLLTESELEVFNTADRFTDAAEASAEDEAPVPDSGAEVAHSNVPSPELEQAADHLVDGEYADGASLDERVWPSAGGGAGWLAGAGEVSAADEYRRLHLTQQRDELVLAPSIRPAELSAGAGWDELPCPDIIAHSTTRPNRFCVQCGQQRPLDSEWASA